MSVFLQGAIQEFLKRNFATELKVPLEESKKMQKDSLLKETFLEESAFEFNSEVLESWHLEMRVVWKSAWRFLEESAECSLQKYVERTWMDMRLSRINISNRLFLVRKKVLLYLRRNAYASFQGSFLNLPYIFILTIKAWCQREENTKSVVVEDMSLQPDFSKSKRPSCMQDRRKDGGSLEAESTDAQTSVTSVW